MICGDRFGSHCGHCKKHQKYLKFVLISVGIDEGHDEELDEEILMDYDDSCGLCSPPIVQGSCGGGLWLSWGVCPYASPSFCYIITLGYP